MEGGRKGKRVGGEEEIGRWVKTVIGQEKPDEVHQGEKGLF